MTTDDRRAQEALRDLHDPLARIELAASQLARADVPTRVLPLVDRILEAARDLDRRLQDARASLEPLAADSHARDDCREAVSDAIEEMAPVLNARGIRVAPPALPEQRIGGDRRFARRALLQLLRAGGRWSRDGGELAVALREAEGAYGIELRCLGSGGALDDAFDEARRFARTAGAELVTHAADSANDAITATLWRRRAEAPA